MKQYSRAGSIILLSLSVGILTSCSSSKSTAFENGKPEHAERYAMSVGEIKSAAQKGDADAQYALGFMYYYGKQVDRDVAAAKEWIHKAANQGQPRAITALKLLGEPVPDKKVEVAELQPSQKDTKIAENRADPEFSRGHNGPQPQPSPRPKEVSVAEVESKPEAVTVEGKSEAANPPVKIARKVKSSSTEQQLLNIKDDHFTLQLLGSHNIAQVQAVITQNHLDSKASIYHTTLNGKDWYVLIYGDYATPDDALSAIEKLPTKAQELKPWVKPIASVKVAIRTPDPSHT